jgi:hypothetical protein
MKDILKYIYKEYGYSKTRFSIIVFADTASTILDFRQNAQFKDKKMVGLISSIPRSQGRSNLNAALAAADRGFDNSPSQPGARKVRLK